jgi:uroporphyrinogen decarboxylase
MVRNGRRNTVRPKERVLAAMRRQVPDRVPMTMSFTPHKLAEFRERTGAKNPAEYFGFEVRGVDLALGPEEAEALEQARQQTDYLPYVGRLASSSQRARFLPYLEPLAPGAFVNEWGIGIVPGSTANYADYVHPLRNVTSPEELEDYPFPDVTAEYRYEGLAEQVADLHEQGYAASGGIPHYSGTLFECAWIMRGMENLLADFLLHPKLAAALLDRLTVSAVGSGIKLARAGIDILHTGDDVGSQRGMMMSPALWRRWLKPRMEEIIAAAKAVNPDLLVFYHSDGNIEAIIPELIEIGVDILNPVQPECMDPELLKREYGNHLAFWGTIGTQSTMPHATAEEVKAVIRERIETVGRGGGLLLAPTHVLEPDVPWENIVAFVEAVEEYGYY